MADQKELAILELVAYGFALHAVVARGASTGVVVNDAPDPHDESKDKLDPDVIRAARVLSRHYVQFAQELEAKFGALFHG